MSASATRLLVLGWYAVLAVVWAMTNPPFAAPDEAAHYLRAVGVSDGSLVGRPAHLTGPGLDVKLVIPREPSPLQLAWVNQATRAVAVPAGLSPEGFDCEVREPRASAACTREASINPSVVQEITSVGTYQPFPYLLPAALLRVDPHAAGSLRLARLATIAMWLALLAVAIFALWDEALGGASLSGLLVAVTPMAVFVGSSLSGSSLEVMGSIAFFASLLSVARGLGGQDPLTRPLLAAGASGLVLALSRSTGPLWVLLGLALAALASDPRQLRARLAGNRRAAGAAGGLVLVGLVLNRYWEARYGPHVAVSLLPGAAGLRAGVSSLIHSQAGLIGNFGYLNLPLPHVLAIAWWLLALALVLAGLRWGERRARRALILAAALAVAVPVYLEAAVLRNTGYGLQPRHYLPFVALLPILAFEAVRRSGWARARVRPLFAVLVAGTAAMQVWAWWTNAHRYAVGSGGRLWFLDGAEWSPPLGWWPWVAVLVCAATALTVEMVARRRPDADVERAPA
jgi:Predicted membrane protein (DUF2142)